MACTLKIVLEQIDAAERDGVPLTSLPVDIKFLKLVQRPDFHLLSTVWELLVKLDSSEDESFRTVQLKKLQALKHELEALTFQGVVEAPVNQQEFPG